MNSRHCFHQVLVALSEFKNFNLFEPRKMQSFIEKAFNINSLYVLLIYLETRSDNKKSYRVQHIDCIFMYNSPAKLILIRCCRKVGPEKSVAKPALSLLRGFK
jgi:hypothetical protein